MQVSNDVLAVLSEARVEGNKLFLEGQLDRRLYTNTNKVLEAAGGKWNRKEKAHIFDGSAEGRIDGIILSGSVVVPKDDFNFFPTPEKIINTMVTSANIQDGDRVLEPSCGDGRIVKAVAKAAKNLNIVAVELDEKRVQQLNSDPEITSLVNPEFTGTSLELVNADFLSHEMDEKFDVIIMNPPFKNKADIKHTNRALDLLLSGGVYTQGGRLRGILSAGVLFREDALTKAFRERVKLLGGSFTELEDKAFKESGTMVKTVLLEIDL
nr:methyltransferase [Providencia rettgeri]